MNPSRQSAFPRQYGPLDARRDAGAFSYGFSVFDRAHFTLFRTDEFDINFNGAPSFTSFVEYRPGPQTSVTLDLQHIFGKRRRLISIPTRMNPDFAVDEFRERDRHLDFGLTIKQSFGGAGVAKTD